MEVGKPNILFVFADDQRFDTIGALGNAEIYTPHLDRLVESGTVFTRAHIPGGSSAAVCMPSRAMLHTGRTLFRIHGEGQSIPPEHALLGESLRGAGYETFGTGKWHNGTASYARSFSAGGEIFFGGMDDHWNVPACDFDESGKYEKEQPFIKNPQGEREVRKRLADHIYPGVHSTDLFTGATIEFLHNRDKDRPFFAYVSLMAPHDPRTMPRQFLEMYDAQKLTLPSNFQPEHIIDTGALRVRDELLAKIPREPDEIRQHLAEYYAMISHLDDGLGRIIETLASRGELDETIIVFSGDNGLALGQHGLLGKQNLYEHSVRVPLIFSGPGIGRGVRRDDLVYLMDICPTLCSLAGAPVAESMEACDLSTVLRGDAERTGHEVLYLAYCDTIRGVSDGDFKLIEYYGGETQLFDLRNDPAELHNLADEPGHEMKRNELRKSLVRLSREWEEEERPAGKTFWSKRRDLVGWA